MKSSVLFVGGVAAMRRLVDAIERQHEVTIAHDVQRGCALLYIGCFEAVVAPKTSEDPLSVIATRRGIELVTLGDDIQVEDASRQIETAIATTRARAVKGARDTAFLTKLTYRELLAHVRGRAVYEYLTALLAAHGGHVTEAAAACRIERESFHRLLRRARIRADDYRARDPEKTDDAD